MCVLRSRRCSAGGGEVEAVQCGACGARVEMGVGAGALRGVLMVNSKLRDGQTASAVRCCSCCCVVVYML